MGSIYYHGTNKKNAENIVKTGFRKGTYFTWDLHSALVMGGNYIFAIYFPDKEITDYWEWISNKVIPYKYVLYYRKFSIRLIYDNEKAQEKLRKSYHKGKHCKKCKGKGELEERPPYKYMEVKKKHKLIVCPNCKGFGYTKN